MWGVRRQCESFSPHIRDAGQWRSNTLLNRQTSQRTSRETSHSKRLLRKNSQETLRYAQISFTAALYNTYLQFAPFFYPWMASFYAFLCSFTSFLYHFTSFRGVLRLFESLGHSIIKQNIKHRPLLNSQNTKASVNWGVPLSAPSLSRCFIGLTVIKLFHVQ